MGLISQFAEIALWLALVALVVFGIAYALRPAHAVGRHLKETLLAFVALFFLLLGLRMMLGSINDPGILLGDFFASLALTVFWVMRRRIPDR